MTIIPVLSLCNFIFPSIFRHGDLGIVIAVSIVLALSGFIVIKRIIDSIIKLNSEVRSITRGELSHEITVRRDDEIGELSSAMNQLTGHIRDNMDELKIYGERTKDINSKINRQLVALNGVLQIGDLISAKMTLKDIFEITVCRLSQVTDSSAAFILLEQHGRLEVAAQFGLAAGVVTAINMPANEYVLSTLRDIKTAVEISERDHQGPKSELLKLLNVKNIAVYPLFVRARSEGFLVMAGQSPGGYTEDDEELLDVFAKQLVIAIENDYLTKKVDDLEVIDSLTGLFNRRYIADRLEEEILRAISNQRPCSFIVLKIRGLQETLDKAGDMVVGDLLRQTAEILKNYLSEFDRAGRIEYDEFALIFTEKNKKQAQALAQQIKNKVTEALEVVRTEKKFDIRVAVVENPIDGADAQALMVKAKELLV